MSTAPHLWRKLLDARKAGARLVVVDPFRLPGQRRAALGRPPEFRCVARVSDDARAGVAVAPMDWWKRGYEGGRSSQATTSQELTEAGNAPTFNDIRVEVEAVRG
jgi:anaerobic selenocysteine-containing dehydrogenase